MTETDAQAIGTGPSHIESPKLRYEAWKALVWGLVIGGLWLTVHLAQTLMVLFGALVFAAMIDGGARLLGRVLPIGRGIRIAIVLVLTLAFFAWLGYFAGSQISQQAAEFPQIVTEQVGRLLGWLQSKGFAIGADEVRSVAQQMVSGVGTVSKAIGGVFGGFTTLLLIAIIGIYLAIDPRAYERGAAWMIPQSRREAFLDTFSHQAYTMRRLLAGRLLGMAFEGLITYFLLAWLGVPMAALLGLLTGLLAFIPNIGALVSGALMVLVGFSGGTEMGLWTIGVYLLVQNFDGYVIVPMIAKKTVDLAPALVLAFQLIFGVLFGIVGLALADPALAMIKVALERRAARIEGDDDAPPPPPEVAPA